MSRGFSSKFTLYDFGLAVGKQILSNYVFVVLDKMGIPKTASKSDSGKAPGSVIQDRN